MDLCLRSRKHQHPVVGRFVMIGLLSALGCLLYNTQSRALVCPPYRLIKASKDCQCRTPSRIYCGLLAEHYASLPNFVYLWAKQSIRLPNEAPVDNLCMTCMQFVQMSLLRLCPTSPRTCSAITETPKQYLSGSRNLACKEQTMRPMLPNTNSFIYRPMSNGLATT